MFLANGVPHQEEQQTLPLAEITKGPAKSIMDQSFSKESVDIAIKGKTTTEVVSEQSVSNPNGFGGSRQFSTHRLLPLPCHPPQSPKPILNVFKYVNDLFPSQAEGGQAWRNFCLERNGHDFGRHLWLKCRVALPRLISSERGRSFLGGRKGLMKPYCQSHKKYRSSRLQHRKLILFAVWGKTRLKVSRYKRKANGNHYHH